MYHAHALMRISNGSVIVLSWFLIYEDVSPKYGQPFGPAKELLPLPDSVK